MIFAILFAGICLIVALRPLIHSAIALYIVHHRPLWTSAPPELPEGKPLTVRILQAFPASSVPPAEPLTPEIVVECLLRQIATAPNKPETYLALETFTGFLDPFHAQNGYPQARWITALEQSKNHRDPLRRGAARLLLSKVYESRGGDAFGWLDTLSSMADPEDRPPGFLLYAIAGIAEIGRAPIWRKTAERYWDSVLRDKQAGALRGLAFYSRIWAIRFYSKKTAWYSALFEQVRREDPIFADRVEAMDLRFEEARLLNARPVGTANDAQARQLLENQRKRYDFEMARLRGIRAYLDDPWPVSGIVEISHCFDVPQLESVVREFNRIEDPYGCMRDLKDFIDYQLANEYEGQRQWDKALAIYDRLASSPEFGWRVESNRSIIQSKMGAEPKIRKP